MAVTRSTSTGWLQDGGGVTRSTSKGWSQQESPAAPAGGGIRNPLAGPLALRNPLGRIK